MDFHSLTRKELQTLCKRNKIPANITNVAMADALKALEIVEGLDEFVNQSPEKTTNKTSHDIPSTVNRTSTRRKTTKEEPQSTQPTTQTRRTTRRTTELDDENKNVNVPETPVTATTTRRRAQRTKSEIEEQKKTDLLETHVLLSGRRRPGVGSNRRKVEPPKEGSVQQSYGTRRSVRLLEKCMTGLSLKESERMDPVKIDEMVEDEVEEDKNGQSEAPAELPLARNLSVSLENEMDSKDDVLENSKCNHRGGNDSEVISEAGSHKSNNLDAKDVSPEEKTYESEAYLAKRADKQADISDGTIDPKGLDDLAVSENSNEELVDETKSINVQVSDAFEEISEDGLDHSAPAEFMEPIEVVSVEANNAPQDITIVMLNDDLAKLPDSEENQGGMSQNVSVPPKGNEESEDASDQIVTESTISKGFLGDSDIDEDASDQIVTESTISKGFLGDSDIDDDAGSDNSSSDEPQEEVSSEQKGISITTAAYSSEDPMINMVNEEALVDVNVAEAEITHVVECSFQNAPQSVVDYIPNDKMLDDAEALVDVCVNPAEEFEETTQEILHMVNEEALVDVNVAEAEITHVVESSLHNAPQYVVDYIPIDKMLDDAEALVDVCVNPAVEFEETAQEIIPEETSPTAAKLPSPRPSIVSNSAATTSVPIPLAAQFCQPTGITPRKSSSIKQTTIPKVVQVSYNNNKENIDNNSAKEVETNIGKVKRSKNIIDEETMQKLEGMSLRNLKKLTKMLGKLQITDNMKNKEDKNDNSTWEDQTCLANAATELYEHWRNKEAKHGTTIALIKGQLLH
ncbi:hypothetical protein DITRI_Ditri06bG0101700 [Diplodiscus trichospermus]